jgi:hypothetical protein
MVWTREALIWKLRALKVQPSEHGSNQERISVKFWKADRTVVRSDSAYVFQARRSFELAAYK